MSHRTGTSPEYQLTPRIPNKRRVTRSRAHNAATPRDEAHATGGECNWPSARVSPECIRFSRVLPQIRKEFPALDCRSQCLARRFVGLDRHAVREPAVFFPLLAR